MARERTSFSDTTSDSKFSWQYSLPFHLTA